LVGVVVQAIMNYMSQSCVDRAVVGAGMYVLGTEHVHSARPSVVVPLANA
jgi:hypothetical protein